MKRIGLISDTHGYLDEAVFKHFEHCDEVWHGGDFGSLEANLAFTEPKLVQAIRTEFNEKIYPNTERIEKPGTTIPHQLGRFLSFMLIRLSLKLLMFTNRYPR